MIPTVTNAPSVELPKHSLVDVVNIVSPANDRWETGITFTPTTCDNGFAQAVNCPSPVDPAAMECTPAIEFSAFEIKIPFEWTTMDMAADPEKIARDALDLGGTRLIERTLWTGTTTQADGSGTTTTAGINAFTTDPIEVGGGAVSAQVALGSVLAELQNSTTHLGGRATIHVNSLVAVLLDSALVIGSDDNLYTRVGANPVVVGDYPDNAVVGHLGEVDLYLGKIETEDFTDRVTNEYYVVAKRSVLAAYNSCVVAIATVDVG